jgi:hypothetical protein
VERPSIFGNSFSKLLLKLFAAFLRVYIATIKAHRIRQSIADIFAFPGVLLLMCQNSHVPLISQEAVQGAPSIRAYNVTDKFVTESQRRVDTNLMCYYPSICSNR